MPGVLRSTACQPCKDLRSKCDQKWPYCTQCKRRGQTCPGPSSLIKFVNSGTGPSNAAKPRKTPQAIIKLGSASTKADAHLSLDVISKTSSSSSRKIPSGYVTNFRLRAAAAIPRSTPGSIEDLVASRLINCMTKDSCLDSKSYFKFIPSRLSSSSCLRDSVQLFCSTVNDYKLRLSADQAETVKNYVQALNSLRHSLQGSQASKMETLTSIALLGRAEEFINPEWKPFRKVHAEGIMLLTKQLGPPDLEDDYGCAVFFENFEMLVFHFITTGTKSFLEDPRWGVEVAAVKYIRPELQPYVPELFTMVREDFARAPGLLQKVRGIYNDPTSPDSASRATRIMTALSEKRRSIGYYVDKAIEISVEVGEIRIVHNPDGLTEKTYETGVTFLNRTLLFAMGLLLAITRIQFDLRVLYDFEKSAFYFKEYRSSCEQLWMFIPLLLDIERVISSRVVTPLALSFEAADGYEQDFLIKTVIEMDSHRKRLPRDREKLVGCLLAEAKMLTSRRPMEAD